MSTCAALGRVCVCVCVSCVCVAIYPFGYAQRKSEDPKLKVGAQLSRSDFYVTRDTRRHGRDAWARAMCTATQNSTRFSCPLRCLYCDDVRGSLFLASRVSRAAREPRWDQSGTPSQALTRAPSRHGGRGETRAPPRPAHSTATILTGRSRHGRRSTCGRSC